MSITGEHVLKAVGIAAVAVAAAAIVLPENLIHVALVAAFVAAGWLGVRGRRRSVDRAGLSRLKGYAGWDSVELTGRAPQASHLR